MAICSGGLNYMSPMFCRNRLSIGTTQAIYFLIAKRFVPTMSMTMLEIYHNFMDQDGFLYVCYASEEWFGGRNSWGQGE